MELNKLMLKDGEKILIGANLELSISIKRKDNILEIEGPFNRMSKTMILSVYGMEIK